GHVSRARTSVAEGLPRARCRRNASADRAWRGVARGRLPDGCRPPRLTICARQKVSGGPFLAGIDRSVPARRPPPAVGVQVRLKAHPASLELAVAGHEVRSDMAVGLRHDDGEGLRNVRIPNLALEIATVFFEEIEH